MSEQWHPTKNGDLKPEDVTAGSQLTVWWHCSKGIDHDWPAKVGSRVIRGTRCRFCTGRAVLPSESLAVTHPDVAAQWHKTRNGLLRPDQGSYGSEKHAWWQCDKYKSHAWRAQIRSRTGVIPSGCRHCAAIAGKGVPSTPESEPQEEERRDAIA